MGSVGRLRAPSYEELDLASSCMTLGKPSLPVGEAGSGHALLVTQACAWIMDLYMFVNHKAHSGFQGWRGLLLRCLNSRNVGSEHMALNHLHGNWRCQGSTSSPSAPRLN